MAVSTVPDSTVDTSCPLDCPDSCSLAVTVKDGRVTKITGSARNSLTRGFICSKVRNFPRHLYGEERLTQPLLRSGAKGTAQFSPLDWDAALDLLAERLRDTAAQHGGEAILPLYYGGSNGYLTQDAADTRLFYRLGASRLARTVCAAPTRSAANGLYGLMAGVALEDYVHARLIVVWGANPSSSGIHLVPIIQEAQARGAKLVVVDPRQTPLAKKADLHLALRPGTDLAVALAVHGWLFANGAADRAFLSAHTLGADELARRSLPWTCERAAQVAGIAAADLLTLARLYAESSPAVIRCGWGQERNRNGGSATAAILALPAVAGKFGQRGGGYTMSNSGAWTISSKHLVGEPTPSTRLVNMNRVGALLLAEAEPPVKLLFVYNCNPLMTLPQQEKVRAGLEREDLFTVVYDQVKTDTARYADLLLPATTFLEHHELSRGYGALVLHDSPPVIPPWGAARPNYQVFDELARRLGLVRPGEVTTPAEWVSGLLASSGRGAELRADLDAVGIAAPTCGRHPVQFVDVFPGTPDRKVHLVPPDLDAEAPQGLYAYLEDPGTAAYPLALISPAMARTISSTFGQLHREQVALEIHPQDAAVRQLQNGEAVRVWNEIGEVHCHVRISKELRPGVVMLPKGLWIHHTLNGKTANALAPDSLTDLAGGACFNDARVEVARLF